MPEEFCLVAVKRRWVPEMLFAMFKWVIPYQPFRWVFTTSMYRAHLACGEVLNGIDDDPSGVWECSKPSGHTGEHVDGDNGQTWG